MCKKGKQLEHPIHKITIIECLTCEKMVKENQDHYCSPTRETDQTTLADKLWWDTTHSESQIPSEVTEEWYSEFQDGYETPPQQEVPISQAYQQGLQSSVESEGLKESKWDSKMDDYDEESKEYYQEHRANYGDLQMK